MQLVTGGNANAVRLTEENDWYIVPVVNPDGYKYSWTNVSDIPLELYSLLICLDNYFVQRMFNLILEEV